MKKMMIGAALVAAVVCGCRVVEVTRPGQTVATLDGKVVTTKAGEPVILDGGWSVYHNQHWMWTQVDTMDAHIKPDDISFSMNGLNSQPSSNLVALVETSFNGVNTLAAKIIAACVTSGGSTAAEAAITLGTALYQKFKAAGGDETKATVTTDASGNVVVTDGTVTCNGSECTTCTDGSCTVK